MKIQKFKITNLQWDVPHGCEDDFEECQRSGSVKPCYIVELAEDEDPKAVIPAQITLWSGWTPTSWTATPYQKAS